MAGIPPDPGRVRGRARRGRGGRRGRGDVLALRRAQRQRPGCRERQQRLPGKSAASPPRTGVHRGRVVPGQAEISQDDRLDRARQRGRQPVRDRGDRALGRAAARRGHPGQQLQRQGQPAGHRLHHRGDHPGRAAARLRPHHQGDACPAPAPRIGLSTALAVLPGGWVAVGSAPSANGQAATAKAGCLIFLNNLGQVAETMAGRPSTAPGTPPPPATAGPPACSSPTRSAAPPPARERSWRKGHRDPVSLRLSRPGTAAAGRDHDRHRARRAGQRVPRSSSARPGSASAAPTPCYVADTATSAITAIPGALYRHASAARAWP